MSKPWYQETPIYDMWTTDRSNFTPLGYVVLWFPWLLLAIMLTTMMAILFVGFVILLGPIALLIDGGDRLDKKYHINDWINGKLCKTSQLLKLLKRC